MYGQPLEPKNTTFRLFIDDGEDEINLRCDGDIAVELTDDEDGGNDNINDINHPDWDENWEASCEGVFIASKFKTIKEARKWLLSIGMSEAGDSIKTGKRKTDTEKSEYSEYSIEELKDFLDEAVESEEFEKAGEIDREIKERK